MNNKRITRYPFTHDGAVYCAYLFPGGWAVVDASDHYRMAILKYGFATLEEAVQSVKGAV